MKSGFCIGLVGALSEEIGVPASIPNWGRFLSKHTARVVWFACQPFLVSFLVLPFFMQ
jgi:hypothetical protein